MIINQYNLIKQDVNNNRTLLDFFSIERTILKTKLKNQTTP